MQKVIEDYLEKSKQLEQQDREKLLISYGIFSREYPPDNCECFGSDVYSATDENGKCYKKVPITVTDEEWMAVKNAYISKKPAITKRNNKVASVITIISVVIYVCGFIIGILSGTDIYGDFSFASVLVYWFASLVFGMMLQGLAEVIYLLDSIVQQHK